MMKSSSEDNDKKRKIEIVSSTTRSDSFDEGQKQKRFRKERIPKPGEKGYKTPTQLRNERKRRAKRKQKQKQKQQPSSPTSSRITTDDERNTNENLTCEIRENGTKTTAKYFDDPSSKYLSDPLKTPIIRKATAFFKTISLDFPITLQQNTQGWRTVSKLAVRNNPQNQLSIGLFAPKTHTIIPSSQSPAHHTSINTATLHLQRLCRARNIQPYDEHSGQGQLRHVALNVQRNTGKVQITLVWNGSHQKQDQSLHQLCQNIISAGMARKRRRGTKAQPESPQTNTKPLQLHSLWVHFNHASKHSNAIFDISNGTETWKHIHGPKYIKETLSLNQQPKPIQLHFPPNVFRQANLDAFTKIVSTIRLRLQQFINDHGPATALELYGGVGTIGLNLADLVLTLTSSDENPHNKDCFEQSAQEADLQCVSYESKNAVAMVRSNALDNADVILVDPPRKGLEDEVCHALCQLKNAKLLVYVSCGFDAFQRDYHSLTAKAFKIEHAEGHVLFPGSDAIETLSFFIKK